MTTIAYSQGILVSDTQLSWGSERHYTRKITELSRTGLVIACAGIAKSERRAHEIFNDPGWKSMDLSERAKEFSALLFDGDELYLLTGNYIPIPITDQYIAIGTGAPYALAAMSLGCSAKDAVKVASQFDIYTNNVTESYELSQK
jgi:ATP-dependent protease HslVU (ClpYQ) peptidase subunit